MCSMFLYIVSQSYISFLNQIYKAELMIKCGNVCLKDEKQLGDEIKQMKSKRSQLAVNMGSPDEFRHLLERKNQTEKRLKVHTHLFINIGI